MTLLSWLGARLRTRSMSAIPQVGAKSPATLAGTARNVAKAVLIGAVPPLMLKTAANPGGLPIEVFDGIRAGVAADRSQFFKDLTLPFYGYNRRARRFRRRARVILAARDDGWLSCRLLLHQGIFRDGPDRGPEENRCADAHPPRGRRPDRTDGDSPLLSAKIIKNATLKIYKGAPHRHVHYTQGSGERGPPGVFKA